MALEISTSIQTLGDVLNFMSPFAGGSVPDGDSQEYSDWVRWIQIKQEEYARRAFWRRCLTRETITLDGETTVLPDRFNRPNSLYMLIVDGVDWNETPNTDEQNVFVEMNNDFDHADFGKWQMRFLNEADNDEAILWYFANPPKPTAESDILILPGDMIGYSALSEYFRTTGAEGSQDKAEEDAENRFIEYLSIEVIPDKSELLRNSESDTRTDRLAIARGYYANRSMRNYQS
jgi:hypothetical protein